MDAMVGTASFLRGSGSYWRVAGFDKLFVLH
jgi:hypothetical protein